MSTATQTAQVNETNPLAHLVAHIAYAPREAVLQEIVRVWSANQDKVRFESFTRRILHLRSAVSDTEFQAQACDLILWFGRETPYMNSEPHTVGAELLEANVLHSTPSFLHALSEPHAIWRVDLQAPTKRLQISDPRLAWRGRDVEWGRVLQTARAIDMDPQFKKWTSALFLRVNGEPWRVSWINPDSGEMSCQGSHGGYQVRHINDWRARWLA